MNILEKEASLYLQQHAQNPVWWLPWGEEALAKSKAENKPIILSIGYSACHWCHVMEHESFENEDIAAAMNANFIAIKVDREERPDIDMIYMEAVQMMGLNGGWPLNVFLLPDGSPFYGGTYFPPAQWLHLLGQIDTAYRDNYEDLAKSGAGFKEALAAGLQKPTNQENTAIDWQKVAAAYTADFDRARGGMGQAPKFPMPSTYQGLYALGSILGKPDLKAHANLSLRKMAYGGIYDQVGGGFCRYSTDAEWHVPHFEKMLYDNAQLLSLFAAAFKHTADIQYRDICLETIQFVKREMSLQGGGFYASIDADSDGEEGTFYCFTYQELGTILGDDLALFCAFYQCTEVGNWEGKNILFRNQSEEDFAKEHSMAEFNFHHKVLGWKKLLFEAREKRSRPTTDTKAIVSWNALMIVGLVDCYRYVNEPQALAMAIEAIEFIEDTAFAKGELLHLAGREAREIGGFLDDYAAVVLAYSALYQATFQIKYFDRAQSLVGFMLERFAAEGNMLNYADSERNTLIANRIELNDNVIPSSNSMACKALIEIGLLAGNETWLSRAKAMTTEMHSAMQAYPRFASGWVLDALMLEGHLAEFYFAAPDVLQMRREIDCMDYALTLLAAPQHKVRATVPAAMAKLSQLVKPEIVLCHQLTCHQAVERLSDLPLH